MLSLEKRLRLYCQLLDPSFHLIVTRDASDSDSRGHNKSASGKENSVAGKNGQSNMVDLNKGIRREVTRLSERWSALLVHASQWQAKLDDMLPVSSSKILKLHIGCMQKN